MFSTYLSLISPELFLLLFISPVNGVLRQRTGDVVQGDHLSRVSRHDQTKWDREWVRPDGSHQRLSQLRFATGNRPDQTLLSSIWTPVEHPCVVAITPLKSVGDDTQRIIRECSCFEVTDLANLSEISLKITEERVLLSPEPVWESSRLYVFFRVKENQGQLFLQPWVLCKQELIMVNSAHF